MSKRPYSLVRRLPGLLLLPLAACTTLSTPTLEPVAYPQVGEVSLKIAEAEPAQHQLLDIGIVVFDDDEDESAARTYGDRVFAEVRDKEIRYLPFLLRKVLIESQQWGAVRVLPEADPSVDLLISGKILRSSGTELAIQIDSADSTGRSWLSAIYGDAAMLSDYPEEIRFTPSRPFIPSEHQEPFQDLYEKIGNDLVAIRDTLSVSALQTIHDVSTLVYANDLSPESFGHMLATNDEGLLEAASLPAKSDPMFARVEDMRVRHHAFIDTVDEYYGALHDEMLQAYIMWRRHSYDQQEQLVSRKQEPISQDFFSSSSGYLTMTQRYNRFRWSKIYRQEFQELAAGFNQELAPAILELNEQIHGLSGTMAEQYVQWRRILRQLFELEIGRI
ncbi:MAG: hypothetical protein VYC52_02690 [Pseudomonadota bacterium]|nr:hypothetical protein [Pseudomonadota bacterium]